jgi:hypothetical protein
MEQTEENRAQLGAQKPNKNGHFHLSDTALGPLGAGRSQVQILSPRLKYLQNRRFWQADRKGEIGLGSNFLTACSQLD